MRNYKVAENGGVGRRSVGQVGSVSKSITQRRVITMKSIVAAVLVLALSFNLIAGVAFSGFGQQNGSSQGATPAQYKPQPQGIPVAVLAAYCVVGAGEAAVWYLLTTPMNKWKVNDLASRMVIGCAIQAALGPVLNKAVKFLTPVFQKAGKAILKAGGKNVDKIIKTFIRDIEKALEKILQGA